jgi:two-component system nitrate/nitrite response regulator NarL
LSKSSGRAGTVKVFIADGSRLSYQLIAAAVRRGRYRTRVVGYATDAVGIREGLEKNEADVAVIGARLEDEVLAGFDITREILASRSKPNVIIILDSNKPAMVVEAFRAGASGIFSREQSSELLCKCIHVVHKGQIWASSKELHFVIDALGPALAAKSISLRGTGLLTKRQKGVVHLVAEGMTNRDISQELKLSEHTVRNYLFRIFNKVLGKVPPSIPIRPYKGIWYKSDSCQVHDVPLRTNRRTRIAHKSGLLQTVPPFYCPADDVRDKLFGYRVSRGALVLGKVIGPRRSLNY